MTPELPKYVKNFIVGESEVLLIFEYIGNSPVYLIMRSLSNKAFAGFGFSKGFLYGMGDLDLKYNDVLNISRRA